MMPMNKHSLSTLGSTLLNVYSQQTLNGELFNFQWVIRSQTGGSLFWSLQWAYDYILNCLLLLKRTLGLDGTDPYTTGVNWWNPDLNQSVYAWHIPGHTGSSEEVQRLVLDGGGLCPLLMQVLLQPQGKLDLRSPTAWRAGLSREKRGLNLNTRMLDWTKLQTILHPVYSLHKQINLYFLKTGNLKETVC